MFYFSTPHTKWSVIDFIEILRHVIILHVLFFFIRVSTVQYKAYGMLTWKIPMTKSSPLCRDN